MRKRYTVFAALYDDTNQGWIWMPKEKGFNSRDYITLKSTEEELGTGSDLFVNSRRDI